MGDRQKSLDLLISEFEESLAQFGTNVPRNILRDGIIKDMKAKLGSSLPESTVREVINHLLSTAENKQAFASKLQDMRARSVPHLSQFLMLLKGVNDSPNVRQALAAMADVGGRAAAPPLNEAPPPAMRIKAGSSAYSGTPDPSGMSTPAKQPQLKAAGLHSNPVFNQDVHSPLLRARDYTPALLEQLSPRGRQGKSVLQDIGDLLHAGRGPEPSSPLLQRIPDWNFTRPYLTGLHIAKAPTTESSGAQPLDLLPQSMQETAVVNDLLYAFLGLEGRYIKPHLHCTQNCTQLAFTVEGSLHPSLMELVQRVLPICEYVVVLKRFIETRSGYGYGTVHQALAAAMRQMVADWQLMVGQMEHQLRLGQLSLQPLIYYCQQPLSSLHLLASIAATAASTRDITSAGVLDLLHSRWSALAGDPAARSLLHHLLSAAAVPYFRILEQWLCAGVLDDPYGEFMVQEDKNIEKTDLTSDAQLAYWYQRYTIRQCTQDGGGSKADVPVLLESMTETIFTTGKYLNAIRECGQEVDPPLEAGTRLTYDSSGAYHQLVERAHQHASKALLDFMRRDMQLNSLLNSIKHYFLLDQGDLMVHLLESAKEELRKPASEVLRTRMQSLLELAVRTSSVSSDPHADNVLLDLNPRQLQELVKDSFPNSFIRTVSGTAAAVDDTRRQRYAGWQLLLLNYRVSWPLTLVVSKRQLQQYQIIFKHLFSLKHAERELAAAWHVLQATRVLDRPAQRRLVVCHGVCQRLMFLIQELLRHATTDILEPSWAALQAALRKANNVDQVIESHTTFLRRALEGMLLTLPLVLKVYPQLQRTALNFTSAINTHLAPALEVDVQSASIDGLAHSARNKAAVRIQRTKQLAAAASDPLFLQQVEAVHSEQATRTSDLIAAITAHVEALLRAHDQDPTLPSRPSGSSSGSGLSPLQRAPPRTSLLSVLGSTKESAEMREEVESLRNLIDRLSPQR